MAYWPPWTAETATATCWLAVSDATVTNGCLRFVPGSHLEAELRPHAPGKKCSCTARAVDADFCHLTNSLYTFRYVKVWHADQDPAVSQPHCVAPNPKCDPLHCSWLCCASPEPWPSPAVGASREDSHALVTQLRPNDEVANVPVARGGVSVHSERVIHGSGPNMSPAWRRAYVLARFRSLMFLNGFISGAYVLA